jgi:L-fucose isomerase-like protein
LPAKYSYDKVLSAFIPLLQLKTIHPLPVSYPNRYFNGSYQAKVHICTFFATMIEENWMHTEKTTFALFFGNRGFFPASLIAEARTEIPRILKEQGHDVLMMDEECTRYGAVETTREGQLYANFLRENRGKFGGVILSLPNFGDETGAVAALSEAGVPIFIQAYPDEIHKMSPEWRRDGFCGKLSIMDVFYQYGVNFTVLEPHVVHPCSPRFLENIDYFDRVCRTVNGVKGSIIGAIGARTTPFKTVRIDEVALQRHHITVETLDLSDIFGRMRSLSTEMDAFKSKAHVLQQYTSWAGVPQKAFENIVRLGVVLDQVIDEYQMDAIALRCWTEMQQQLGISGCVILGELNERGISSSCEVDIGNAVVMHALQLASGRPPACLDWNNNYGDDENKCILFHCGPVPKSLMVGEGHISDHAILANAVGQGCGFGCHVGRIAPQDFTFGSLLADAGKLKLYLGEGSFTPDPIPTEFFGCAGVAEIPQLQKVLMHIGRMGYRHHVSLTPGKVMEPMREALERYLGFEVAFPQKGCQC